MKNVKTIYKKICSFFNDTTRKIKKRDLIIIGIIVIIYSFFAFKDLGSIKNPQTFYQFYGSESEAGIELVGDKTLISKIRHYAGDEVGNYDIYISDDGSTYEMVTTMSDESVFSWSDTEINKSFKYMKIVGEEDSYGYIGEVELYDQYGDKIQIKASNLNSEVLTDEENTVPGIISYKNSAYFDEVYFARSAYEYLHGIDAMEWVHPPLGKLIQMLPIIFMGMTPFAYRLMGCIAGILMIPVIYIFAKNIFKSRKYATLAGLLMALDTFHFAQTRMGTVDSFLVLFMMLSALFMYKYIILGKNDGIRPKLKNLALSGLFFGLSTCVKWTGLYLGLGLAIIFFAKMIIDKIQDKKLSKHYPKIILFCLLFFIIIPVIIYVLSYILFPNVYPGNVNGIGAIFNQIKEMFNYHSTLTEVHPFQSKWYTWLIMYKPVWYYVGYYGSNLKSTIVGIGNPAIWWFGILGILYILINTIKNKKKETAFILVMILTMWLPYMFISRGMFMYHFFPVLPFIMLSNVALIKWTVEKFKTNTIYFMYIGLVLLFFIYFYPVVSGTVVTENFVDTIRWFANWVF